MGHPAPPHPLSFFNRIPLLPTILLFFRKHHRLFGLICSLLISIEICAYVLLSWYALRGEALRPPPCNPPPALTGSPCYLLFFCFFSEASSVIWVHFILIDIHRDLSLCASFLVRIAGGRRCALPPAPPHPLLFFNRLPLLPTLFHFFHRHRFFGFIFSFLIFINIHRDLSLCASFLVRIAGGGAAPSPLHPPTRFYFLIGSPCYLLFFLFFISIIVYLGSFYLY